MTPNIQQSEEQKITQQKLKEDFNKALENFENTRGEDLTYRELLKSNPSLDNYFKELIEKALTYHNLELIDLLLSRDETVSKIKINNENILRCLIENFGESISSEIINKHIKKFDSIGEDKDIDGNNLITSLLNVEYGQDKEEIAKVTKLIKILIESGVSVNDKNNLGYTPLDFCYNFEIFKTLAQHASQETLEKKLHYIVEEEDLASEDQINITKFLLKEKNVKIDGFFDWKWPEIPIYRKAIFAQIVLEYGNDEQKKCLQAYSSTDANSPFFAIIDDDIRFDSEPLSFKEEIKEDRITMAIILNKKEALEKIIRDDPEILEEKVGSDDLTPVFYAIDRGKLNALEAIIRARPQQVLDQKDKFGLTPVFYAIDRGKLDALEAIIRARPQQVLDQKDKSGLTPVFYAIDRGKLNALEAIIRARPQQVLDQKDKFGLTPVFYAIDRGKLDALEAIIRARPQQVLDQKDENGLTPVLYAIDRGKLDALKKIISASTEVLDRKDENGSTPVFHAIKEGNVDALEKIISASTEVLDRKDENGFTPVFHAIWFDKLDALEKIIKARSAVLDQKDKSGLTPVFHAIWFDKLDALEKIFKARSAVLDQKDKFGFTPVFYAIDRGKLDALKKILETSEGALEQKNQQGENPILYSLKSYSDNSSDDNKEILKFIFQKQFGRNLQDEEIKNLVEFVNNYNFLKLFYNEYGQAMFDNNLKSILTNVLPREAELEGELSKKLLKIYQKIAEAREKPSIIECHDASGDKTKLHIHYSQLNKHASYFIFHVNDQNKLTMISYCDGNRAFPEQEIIRRDGARSPYINGVTTFELTQPQDFNQKFAEDFIKKNSKKREVVEFYSQEFSPEKLASEEKEIFGIKFSKITHSIPTKMQSRGNCSLKSSNILARFLLTHQERKELFTFDTISGVQGGEGYKSYKDLRQKMVDKAGEKLFESVKNLEKNFLDSIGFFEKMNSLMDRSSMKEESAKPEKSTTKLLQTTLDFIDQINRNKLFKDNLVLDEVNHQKHFNLIATSHLNLSQEDVDKIKFLFEKQEVKIDNFLDWNFQTPQAKNNFVKLVFEHGDEGKKESFNLQLSASNPEKRDKFFKDLSKENLSLIITEFDKPQAQLGKLKNVEKIIEELRDHIQKIENESINFGSVRVGNKRSHDEMTGSFSSEKIDPSSSISGAGGSSASSEKMEVTLRE